MSEKTKFSEMTPAELETHFGGDLSKVTAAMQEMIANPVTVVETTEPKAEPSSTPEAGKAEESAPAQKPEENTVKEPAGEPAKAPTPEEIKAENDRLKAMLEEERTRAKAFEATANKRVNGANAARIAAERRLKELSKPQILTDMPELESAIKHVATSAEAGDPMPDEKQSKVDAFNSIVSEIHPDAVKLGEDPDFQRAFAERMSQYRETLHDHPVEVVKFLSDYKLERASRQSQAERQAAIEAAKAEAKAEAIKLQRELSMQGGIPTGGKGVTPHTPTADDDLERVKRIEREEGLSGIMKEIARRTAG